MTTLYTVELTRDQDRPLWAFVSHRGASLATYLEERSGLLTEDEARTWVANSRMVNDNGWRAMIRVATARQIADRQQGAAA
mgnify:CR=1 FL=1